MRNFLTIKNIVVTGVAHKQVYDDIRSDLLLSCPEVLVKDFKISHAPVNYHRSDIKPRKSDVYGCSFRAGANKLNLLTTRYVSEVKELWLETGQYEPEYLVIHCINGKRNSEVANDDKPHLILTHLASQEPKAILFAIAGNDDIARQVSSYIDVAVYQNYSKYGGLVSKVFYNEAELFRTTYKEILARSLNGLNDVVCAPGVYSLIDEILGLTEMSCVKLSNLNIRERPKQTAGTTYRYDSIGGAAVNYGYNEAWRQYRDATNQWSAVNKVQNASNKAAYNREKPVAEVVKTALDRLNSDNSDGYFYSDCESSSGQERSQRDSGYVTCASYARSIHNVSDSSSADNEYY